MLKRIRLGNRQSQSKLQPCIIIELTPMVPLDNLARSWSGGRDLALVNETWRFVTQPPTSPLRLELFLIKNHIQRNIFILKGRALPRNRSLWSTPNARKLSRPHFCQGGVPRSRVYYPPNGTIYYCILFLNKYCIIKTDSFFFVGMMGLNGTQVKYSAFYPGLMTCKYRMYGVP